MQSNMPLHTRAAHTSSTSSSSSRLQNQQTAFSSALSFKKTHTCISKAISPQRGRQNQVYMRPQIQDNRTLPKHMKKSKTQCYISGRGGCF